MFTHLRILVLISDVYAGFVVSFGEDPTKNNMIWGMLDLNNCSRFSGNFWRAIRGQNAVGHPDLSRMRKFSNQVCVSECCKQSFKNCLRSKFASKMSSKTDLHFGGQSCNKLSPLGWVGLVLHVYISHRLLKCLLLNTYKRKNQGWGGLML